MYFLSRCHSREACPRPDRGAGGPDFGVTSALEISIFLFTGNGLSVLSSRPKGEILDVQQARKAWISPFGRDDR